MATITNGTITLGGTAQTILPDGNLYNVIVFENTSANDMVVNIGAAAAAALGETVYSKTSASFQLWGRSVSVLGTTTADKFSYREAL